MEEKGSILIVDDDVSLCKTMVLRCKGYTVVTAKDGSKAIEKVDEKPFDMIFMDIKIPLMNGVESFKRARPEAAAVMVTGYCQEVADLIEEAPQNNDYACLHKPLDMTEVLKLVDEVWERK